MRTAYLAGPMRGYDHFNFPAFDYAASVLRFLGWTIISPAEHDREQGFDEALNTLDGFDLGAAMLWDLEQVLTVADVVILLPGWSKSLGVALEKHAAEFAGKPVLYWDPGRGVVSGYPVADDNVAVPA